MDFVGIIYLLVLVLSCGYAFAFGGTTGKAGAIIFSLASGFSYWTTSNLLWDHTLYNLLFVDLACLLALIILAMKSSRFWPVWAAGLQLASVMTHIVTVLASGVLPQIYHALASFWSLPILAVMVIGTSLDRQHQLYQSA